MRLTSHTASSRITEWSRDSAYGEARVRSRVLGDYDGDGDIDSDDTTAFFDDWDNAEAAADLDQGDDWDLGDIALFIHAWDSGYDGLSRPPHALCAR